MPPKKGDKRRLAGPKPEQLTVEMARARSPSPKPLPPPPELTEPLKLSINEFDNDLTIVLKTAVASEIPSEFVIIDDQGQVQSAFDAFPEDIDIGPDTLPAIYAQHSELYPWVNHRTWALIFFSQYSDKVSKETMFDLINGFLESRDQDAFPDMENLDYMYMTWQAEVATALVKEKVSLQGIVEAQDFVSKLEPLDASELVPLSERFDYTISLTPDPPTVLYSAILSETVPWVISSYSPDGKGEQVARVVADMSATAFSIFPTEVIPPNQWWVGVWVDPESSGKDSYAIMKIDLIKNIMMVDIPVIRHLDKQIILSRVASAFPGLTFGSFTQKKISGEFFVYNILVGEYSLADMIMNDDLLSTYLAIDETAKPLSGKKRFNFHLKAAHQQIDPTAVEKSRHSAVALSVNATVNQIYTVEGQQVVLDSGQKISFPKDTPYISVGISQGRDLPTVQLFVRIVRRLLRYYLNNKSRVEKEYTLMLGKTKYSTLQPRKSQKFEKPKSLKSRNELLRQQIPDLFIPGFATDCQAHKQPILLSSDEVDDWVDGGQQILRFPAPPQDAWVFGCPTQSNQYPYVLVNKLSNNDKYPYIPCCGSTDQQEPEVKSLFNHIYRQGGTVKDWAPLTKAKHTIKTNKAVAYQRVGTIPPLLDELLRYGVPTQAKPGTVPIFDKNVEIHRWGTVKSPSSLLHCLMLATADEHYLNLKSDEDREKYIIQLRKGLSVNPALLSQEMWDYDSASREHMLRDPAQFLDPQWFYRALEEIFSVNIYTFISDGDNVALAIPRHQYFHVPLFRPRNCVVVYEHRSEPGVMPQCELIVHVDPDTKHTVLQFDDEVDIKLSQAWERMYTVSTYSNVGKSINIYSIYPVYTMVSLASHQIIDSAGKLRGLVISQKKKITVLTLPSAPLNLPAWPNAPFPRCKLQDANKFMGREADTTTGDEATYLFSNDPHLKLSIPLTGTADKSTDTYPVADDGEPDMVAITGHQRAVVGLLLQFINMLMILLSFEGLKESRIPKILKKYVSNNYSDTFDLSKVISPLLPKITSVDELFEYVRKLVPDMVHPTKNQFIVPNEIFKDKLSFHLTKFIEKFHSEKLVMPITLTGIPVKIPKDATDMLLVGGQIQDWKKMRIEPDMRIVESIAQSDSTYTSPIVYYDKELDMTFIVHNTSTLDDAVKVSYIWRKQHRNVYDLDIRALPKQHEYNMYTITAKGSLGLTKRGSGTKLGHILQYDSGFAALLPLTN